MCQKIGRKLGQPVSGQFPLQVRSLHTALMLAKDDECEEESKKPDPCSKQEEGGEKKEGGDAKEGGGKKSGDALAKLLSKRRKGYIHSVIGPVIDVYFPDEIPEVLNAVEVQDAQIGRLVLEVRSSQSLIQLMTNGLL